MKDVPEFFEVELGESLLSRTETLGTFSLITPAYPPLSPRCVCFEACPEGSGTQQGARTGQDRGPDVAALSSCQSPE